MQLIKRTLLLALAVVATSAFAQESGKSTLTRTSTSLSAVRLAVQNGIISFVNNSPQMTFELGWDVLPASDTLLRSKALYPNSRLIRFALSNSDLQGDWLHSGRINKETLGYLRRALYLPDNADVSTLQARSQTFATARQSFMQKWEANPASMLKFLSATQYKAAIRDHYYLTTLFQSQGAGCTVGFSGSDVKGDNPRDFKNVVWHIQLLAPTNPSDETKIPYRAAFSADVPDFRVVFPNGAGKTIGITANFAFLRTTPNGEPVDVFAGIRKQYTSTSFSQNSDLPSGSNLAGDNAESDLAPSSLETDLKIFTGVDLGTLISKGLFGGSQNASIIGGGILGRGKVKQFIGVNNELARNDQNAIGYVLGVVPGSQTMLLGLGIQLGGLTIAPGFVAEPGKTNQNKTTFKGAVGLSYDLSQALGMKGQNLITLENAQIDDTDWRQASDAAFTGQGGILLSYQTRPADKPLPQELRPPTLSFVSAEKDANGMISVRVVNPQGDEKLVMMRLGDQFVRAKRGYDILFGETADDLSEVQTAVDEDGLTQTSLVALAVEDSAPVHYVVSVKPDDSLLSTTDVLSPGDLWAALEALRDVHDLALSEDPTLSATSSAAQLAKAINGVLAKNDLSAIGSLSALLDSDSASPDIVSAIKSATGSEAQKLNSNRVKVNRLLLQLALDSVRHGDAIKKLPLGN